MNNAEQLLHQLPGVTFQGLNDPNRTMLFISHGILQLSGYTADMFTTTKSVTFAQLVHRDDLPTMLDALHKAATQATDYQLIYRLMTVDYREQWVLEKGTPIYSDDGTFEAFVGLMVNHNERVYELQKLEQRIVDRNRKLAALYDILEVAADPSDLNTTITRTLYRVLRAIKGDVGAIHLLTASGEQLQMIAQQNMLQSVTAKISMIRLDQSELAGWIVRQNRPLIIPSISEDPRTVDFVGDDTLDVYIGVPIVKNEQVLGVLTVLSEDMAGYAAKEEVELLISVGEQIGVVVENARLRQSIGQLAVLEERNRLARELHDSVTQSLYSVTLFAEAGRTLANAGNLQKATDYFEDVLQTGQQALKEMRLLVHKLRPDVLEQEGIVRALAQRLHAVEGRAGVKHQLQIAGTIDLNPDMEQMLYQIALEALNNSLKHSGATTIDVIIRQEPNKVTLMIEDNGCGFNLNTAVSTGGFGLISMKERTSTFHGTFNIQTKPQAGTTILVQFPLSNEVS